MKARHPFAVWLVKRHGKAQTPLGDFASEFAAVFPSSGDRARMRSAVEYYVGSDEWPLGCFDVAWEQYEPSCSRPGCLSPAVNGTLCAGHALAELL